MQQLLPVLLEWLSNAPDPDLGLLQLRRLTEGYNALVDGRPSLPRDTVAAERACRIWARAACSALALHRQPEFLDALADDDELSAEPTRAELIDAALDTVDWREDDRARRDGLRRFKRRELLRIGARDLLGFARLTSVGRELSNLADASVEAALQSLEPQSRSR